MLGWIAWISLPSAGAGGALAVHVRPASTLRSKWTCHVLGRSADSVLLGLITVPSAKRTALFLIGPRMPSGKRRAPDHVRAWSREVRTMPHHRCRLGPTL